MKRWLPLCLGLVLAASLASCATVDLVPADVSMPAARAALAPDVRFFYDALADEGDWILIEPFGYVFRPRVNFVSWRPYEQGFWVPSDVYGWTWISTEPFGWATYHYGQWIYDRFDGWVWIPGSEWGPAWVAWQEGDGFVGWAPLGPVGATGYDAVPGGAYTYVPMGQMASTNLPPNLKHASDLVSRRPDLQPVENFAEQAGVRVNLGPARGDVERAVGHDIPTVQISDLLPQGGPANAPKHGGGLMPQNAAADTVSLIRQVAQQQTQEARALVRAGTPPPAKLPLLRVKRHEHAAKPGLLPAGRGAQAPADSTR
jgi:Family of unknown function (DUF6600)